MMDIVGKTITMVGLAKRTGVAVVKALGDKDVNLIVSDIKPESELKEQLQELKDYNLTLDLGGHSERALDCDLIVVSPGVPLDLELFDKAEQRQIPVISEIELAYNLTSSRIVGITGTNGKTTTTGLTGEIMDRGLDQKVITAGNIGKPLINEIKKTGPRDWLVVELSSFQLETVCEFRPEIGVFLNFAPDHLDRHKNIENYLAAKKRIFARQTADDISAVNMDDQDAVEAAAGSRSQRYGVSLQQTLKRGICLQDNNFIFRDGKKSSREKIFSRADVSLPGDHNLYNTAFAALISRLAGVKPEIIQQSIKEFKPAAHRLEKVQELSSGTVFIDDSKATNPAAAVCAIRASERPLVLIAGGQDRKADFSGLSEEIVQKVQYVVLMGETAGKIKELLDKKRYNCYSVKQNMEGAVRKAVEVCSPKSTVLLSPGCPSWDMYESYKKRGKEFQFYVNKLTAGC